jgi:hypothetical protein
VNPFALEKSTKFFSCSNVKNIRMVVGCSRVHAGSHPLNMNIGPSFRREVLITPSVDCRFLGWVGFGMEGKGGEVRGRIRMRY